MVGIAGIDASAVVERRKPVFFARFYIPTNHALAQGFRGKIFQKGQQSAISAVASAQSSCRLPERTRTFG